MKKSYLMIAISMTLVQGCYTAPPYEPSSRVAVGYSGVNLGIHYSTYPDLVRIPGYPVYYAPRVDSNYFFYDGLYWVFHSDNWYVSSWYNGPWDYVGYYDVPVYLLRVPVRYYRQPPPYFRGWRADAPPRWGDHWGRDWERRRSGWDRWDRGSAPAPAPLPAYQRNYSGERYPRAVEQQHRIRSEYYRYQPREPVTQQYFKPRAQQDQQRQLEQQGRQDQQRQLEQQRQQEQQRQLEQRRQQEQQRQLEERRQQEQQRQLEQQRQQEQRRQLERQRQQEQQRQLEERRQLEQQRRQDQQRQLEQQRRQDQQRQLEQQRQKDSQQQRDLERQRSQPESRGKAMDDKAVPQDRVQREKDAQQEYERKKKEYEERYQSR